VAENSQVKVWVPSSGMKFVQNSTEISSVCSDFITCDRITDT